MTHSDTDTSAQGWAWTQDVGGMGEILRRMQNQLNSIYAAVDEQAEDEGLWLEGTAREAYLQQELRRLHRVIEEGKPP